MYGLSSTSKGWLDIGGRQITLKAPSHGENRGSSPLGSAKGPLLILISFGFFEFFPNRRTRFGRGCSPCVLRAERRHLLLGRSGRALRFNVALPQVSCAQGPP